MTKGPAVTGPLSKANVDVVGYLNISGLDSFYQQKLKERYV